MTIGRSDLWLGKFADIDCKVIRAIERLWPTIISKLSQDSLEDRITERVVDILRDDREIIQYGFLSVHFKLREIEIAGSYTTKGILDMALFLDQDHKKYIAYECKRLNTLNSLGKRSGSLAGPYVEEGVVRYITAKYSEKLPYGCMIGYVMDGDIAFAVQQVVAAIKSRSTLLNFGNDPIKVLMNATPEFETAHARKLDKTRITVRHRFFSMAGGSAKVIS